MTNPKDIQVPTWKLIKNVFLDNKSEVFFKQELTDILDSQYDRPFKVKNVRWHANKLVEMENDFERYKISQNDGLVWGFKDAVNELEEMIE